MVNQRKIVHEKFHNQTSSQYRLIGNSNFTYRIILGVINRFIQKKERVLDIGCGAGTLCFYLANKGNMVTGVDISKKAIKSCEETAHNLNLSRQTSFKVLNFPSQTLNEKFDLVILTEVIEHLEDDKLALKRIYQLLDKGGVAIISTPSNKAPLYRLGMTKKFDERVGHLRRYSLEELVEMCEKSGFEVLETRREEGIIRNFLFINPIAGKLLRGVKYFVGDIVSFIDRISLYLFGESDLFVIVRKPQ